MRLEDYIPIVGQHTIDELRFLGAKLFGKKVVNVNSTFVGGGVAEILSRLVPLANQMGLDVHWRVIKGSPEFFTITKKFHNALHGRGNGITREDYDLFLEVSHQNLEEMAVAGDILFIHDPQPIVLVEKKKQIGGKWLWRCHVDVSNPDGAVWDFLQGYVNRYDAAIFSAPSFARELPIPQYLVAPSIDPLSDKNKELSPETIDAVLTRLHLDKDKPLILQVSRFDRLKDPVGVIKAFEMVHHTIDCQLVLAGGTATDDPESMAVLTEVQERAGKNADIHILDLPPDSNLEINALQRAAAVVLQKSIKEGFGLTVSEALWKGKPVVAAAVGGIPLQVRNNFTGLLSHGIEGTARDIRRILANPELARFLGQNGREHVRQNFLITRQLRDYLMVFLALEHPGEFIYL